MKSVVLLSAFLSPRRSGAEAMVEEVSARLAESYSLTIITGRYDRSLPFTDFLSGTTVRVLRVGLGSRWDKYFFPFLAAWRVRRLQPDIVHAVLESYAGIALFFVRFFSPRSTRILTLQSTNTTLFLSTIHRSAQVITAISTVLVLRAKRFCTLPVTLIPNGVDLAAIDRAVASHTRVKGRILFVGRLESMKGVDTLIRAFCLLLAGPYPTPLDERGWHLRIVGHGSQDEALRALARSCGVLQHMTFVGHLSVQDVYDEYAEAEVFCALSLSEALGNVFLEAQASGCVVIGTTVGGIPDIVTHGSTGLLVAPSDSAAAARCLHTVLCDASMRKRLSAEGMRHARLYGWDDISSRYATLYEQW